MSQAWAKFAEKAIFAIQRSCYRDPNIDPFAPPHTTLDNVAKFCGNWVRNSGRKFVEIGYGVLVENL